MRRLLLSVLLCSLLLSAPAPGSAGAQEEEAAEGPPPGAVDGIPVGAEPDDGAPVPEGGDDDDSGSGFQPSQEGAAAASSPPERYFSRGVYQDIEAAVAASPRSSSCSVSNAALKGLVLAPIFFESSGALTASSAPSPMTLSRYDEWNPSHPATTSNLGANQSLYYGRNPYTARARAYWHPGIGIWQYDSAGLGAPYTAVERMDARVIAPAVARRIYQRFCNAKAAGHSDLNARKASWADWVGCANNGCEQVYQELIQAGFSQMRLLDTIDRLGGTSMRTCSMPGRGTFPCAYVDHRQAQGARWWAVDSASVPINDGDPTKPPAPLSLPFYVVKLDGREQRHWLSVDTGYANSVSASRSLGRNARYRTDQAGSGLDWRNSSSLCDLTAGRGACGTVAPPGVSSTSFPVHGTYRPFSLDINGDGLGDLLWYRPGSGSDAVWVGTGPGQFASRTYQVNASYDHVLTGNLDGQAGDDVLWYSSSTGAAHLWRSTGVGADVTSMALAPGPGREPFLLDSDRDGVEEIFWYGPGGTPDEQWTWNGSGYSVTPYNINVRYQPIVGDFDGNGHDDIIWYAPGSTPDHVWFHTRDGGLVSVPTTVTGDHIWRVGDFDGDNRDDVLWYSPGSGADSVWFGVPGGTFSHQPLTISHTYQPVVVDLDGAGRDGVIWYAPGTALDHWWRWSSGRDLGSTPVQIAGSYIPVVGGFSVGGADGVMWYEPGVRADILWHR